MKPVIKWEKWYPPYIDEKMQEDLLPFTDEELTEMQEDGLDIEQNIEDVKQFIPAIQSQFGIHPINQSYSPFDFWVCHTNFYLTDKIYTAIDNLAGVETIEVFTPYRMKVSIGRAFDTRKTLQKIQAKLKSLSQIGV